MAKARTSSKKAVAVKKSAKKGTRGYSTYINRVSNRETRGAFSPQ